MTRTVYLQNNNFKTTISMKKIILLFISIISIFECFAQTAIPRNQISINYSNSYTKGNYLYFVEGERVNFILDSNKKYHATKYEQNTIPFKEKIKKGVKGAVYFMFPSKLNVSNLPSISNKTIDDWIKSLRENNYKKHDFSLKEHFKTLTDEDIINIAKKASQFKKFSSENDLRQKLEQHFKAIKELKDLDEFTIISETRNENLEINNNFKEEVSLDYYNNEGKFEYYRIYLSNLEDSFSPVLSTKVNMELFKNEITAKNYNLDIYWLAYNFLPRDSLIRDKFDIEKIYINWFLKNKL
jgi:hypothetical protein